MNNFAAMSDDDVFSLYSDWYKDVNGFRPRGHSREQAISWMEYESKPEVQAERRAQWDAEAAWLDEMDRKYAI